MPMYRQGDILFLSVSENIIPSVQLAQDDVVMHGALTGHNHVVKNGQFYRTPPSTDRFASAEDQLTIGYLAAHNACEIVHDEHKTLPLPAGVYQVRRQREVNGYVYD